LFSHPNVATLAVAVDVARTSARTDANALEAEIAQMSDEEVARLLAQEEAQARCKPS
jgi:hypothetical protein